jgi:hypothetical protein
MPTGVILNHTQEWGTMVRPIQTANRSLRTLPKLSVELGRDHSDIEVACGIGYLVIEISESPVP